MSLRTCLLSFCLMLPVSAQEAKPLFNGKDLTGWTKVPMANPSTAGWVVEDGGVLHRCRRRRGHFHRPGIRRLRTNLGMENLPRRQQRLEIPRDAISWQRLLGCEYQILDDANHPDGKIGPQRQTASLYDILPPAADKPLKPVGEWNTSKVVVKGNTFEHWLNGTKVLSVDLTSETFKAARAKSKFKAVANFAENPKGRIMLQDHKDEAWFRNITIKSL